MSILDTLILIIKGDVSQLKKDSQEATSETEKLQKNFENLDNASKKMGGSFLDLAKKLGGLVAAYLTADAAIHGFTNAVEYATQLGQASRELQVNAESLDMWGNAVRLTGGTVEGFQSSLKSFAEHLGTTNAIALKALPDLADKLHRMSNFQAMNFGKQVGLSEPVILLLQKGRKELEAILQREKELGVITKNQIEATTKYNIALQQTQQAFRSLYLVLSETILPALTKMFTTFTDFAIYLRAHSHFIEGALIAIAAAATLAAAPFIIAEAGAIALGAAVAGLIGIFALWYEDFKVYMEGGKSLIGEFIDQWPALADAIKYVRDLLRETIGLYTQFTDFISGNNKDVTLGGLLGGRDTGAFNLFGKAKENVELASNSNIGALGTSLFTTHNASNSNSQTSIGQITIYTQANDAYGIANELQRHISYAINNNADGVMM